MFEPTVEEQDIVAARVHHSRLRRICRKLRNRFIWRASRSRNARLTLISQFFPPDFAATGQLLDDLTQRLLPKASRFRYLPGCLPMPSTRVTPNVLNSIPIVVLPYQCIPALARSDSRSRH